MKKLYLEDLEGFTEAKVKKHLIDEYTATKVELKNFDVLVAYESVGSWGCDSSSYFLMQHKSTKCFYEFSGSHCSCYGFENQYEPALTTLSYLKSSKFHFYCGGYDGNETLNQKLVKDYMKQLTK